MPDPAMDTTPPGRPTIQWTTPAGAGEKSIYVIQCLARSTHWNCKLSECHRVPYLALAKTFEKIEEESKRYVYTPLCSLSAPIAVCLTMALWVMCRLKIIATLTNFFRSVIALSPDELVKCVYLCLNKVGIMYCIYFTNFSPLSLSPTSSLISPLLTTPSCHPSFMLLSFPLSQSFLPSLSFLSFPSLSAGTGLWRYGARYRRLATHQGHCRSHR